MKIKAIGLISGTSADGIDAALCEIDATRITCLAQLHAPYTPELSEQILAFSQAGANECHRLGQLDAALGELFAQASLDLLQQAQLPPEAISVIGSHGQTVRHQVTSKPYFTMQLADANIIAARTGIRTVADFRRRDMALGGQGAPFAPAFHAWCFRDATVDTFVANIGGVANITCLPAGSDNVLGFDTGPGNNLMDAWIKTQHQQRFDAGGQWAATGHVQTDLLAQMMADPYLQQAAPKSTGPEYFNLDWLAQFDLDNYQAVDVQATLCQFTASSIAQAIAPSAGAGSRLIVCGGGVHNQTLMRMLKQSLPSIDVMPSDALGVSADYVEAMAFAWLATKTIAGEAIDMTRITGASRPAILGGIYAGDSA